MIPRQFIGLSANAVLSQSSSELIVVLAIPVAILYIARLSNDLDLNPE
jgi:hypothetical protein